MALVKLPLATVLGESMTETDKLEVLVARYDLLLK